MIFIDCKQSLLETAARAYGLPDAELFQTVDLFEKRNIPQVTQCIHALGRYVSNFMERIPSINVNHFRHKRRISKDQHSDQKCRTVMHVTLRMNNYVLDKEWLVYSMMA